MNNILQFAIYTRFNRVFCEICILYNRIAHDNILAGEVVALPMPRGEKKSDAQRRAQNAYDKKIFCVLGCKIKKADAEAFKAACKDSGTTVNAVLTRAATEFVENYKKEEKNNAD